MVDNKKSEFMTWLSDKVSHAQLLELQKALSEIELRANKINLIEGSLYDFLEPTAVKVIMHGIQQSQVWKLIHFMQLEHIHSALNFLLQYASTKYEKKEMSRMSNEEIKSKQINVVSQDELFTPSVNQLDSAINDEEEIRTNGSVTLKQGLSKKILFVNCDVEGCKKLDFNNPQTVKSTKPMLVFLLGKEIAKSVSWSEVYVRILSLLYTDYSDLIPIGVSFIGAKRIDLCNDANYENMVRPREISADVYLETNLSADDIVKRIRYILNLCQISCQELVIYYKSLGETKQNSIGNMLLLNSNFPTHFIENLSLILRDKYRYGFKLESIRELFRLRNFAEAVGFTLPKDDNELKAAISLCGNNIDGKIFVEDNELKEELVKLIDDVIKTGVRVLYYEKIFNSFNDWMMNRNVISESILVYYLHKYIKFCSFSKNFMICGEKNTEKESVTREICRVWGDDKTECIASLSNKLPFIPQENISRVITGNHLFVWVSEGTYVYIDRIAVDEQDKNHILRHVTLLCNNNSYASINEIPLDNIELENYDLPKFALLNAVYEKVLSHSFSLRGKLLTERNTVIDPVLLLKKFIRNLNECTVEQLEDKLKEITGECNRKYIFEALYSEMVRADANLFVSSSLVNFDVDKIDDLISYYITDHFCSIKEISTFALFPHCGQHWNHYLLESYCYKFSKKFCLVVLNFNNKNAGIIMERSFGKSYFEMLSLVVARKNLKRDADIVGTYLFESGYTSKRKFANLDEVIRKADIL